MVSVAKFGLKTRNIPVFRYIEPLGETRECDRPTKRRADLAIANAVLHYVARLKSKPTIIPVSVVQIALKYI